MDKQYWDKIAADYDGEIFSAIANDREDVICSRIREFAGADLTAGDFGCGVGKFLHVLSENFKHVYAYDISDELLKQARENCGDFDNITYARKDLSNQRVKITEVDFALSVNVSIMACAKMRAGIFRRIYRSLRKGAHWVLVVPSLESALFADFRLIQWNLRDGLTYSEAFSELGVGSDSEYAIRQGIVEIDGIGTKHYLKEELVSLFRQMGLEIISIDKVEYLWRTEFEQPPEWMGEPYPWDWLVVLKK